MTNPLKQGLKRKSLRTAMDAKSCRNDESTKTRIETKPASGLALTIHGRNDESTKTRIETRYTGAGRYTPFCVVMTNPLKQGLKQRLIHNLIHT